MVVIRVEKKNSQTFHRPPRGFPHLSYQVESSKFVLKVGLFILHKLAITNTHKNLLVTVKQNSLTKTTNLALY